MKWAEEVQGLRITPAFNYLPGLIADHLQYLARCNPPDQLDGLEPPHMPVRINGSSWRPAYVAAMHFDLQNGSCQAISLRVPGPSAGADQRDLFFSIIREGSGWEVSVFAYKAFPKAYNREIAQQFQILQ